MTKDTQFGNKGSITSTSHAELRTVLITGGCGFIGTNLVKYLFERGYKVRILDNLSTASWVWTANQGPKTADFHSAQGTQEAQQIGLNPVRSLPSTVNLVVGDIRDKAGIEKALQGADAVVHLAAHTSVIESLENPEEDWDINVNGTLNLLEACRRHGVGKFIFASSSAVVGEQIPPIHEEKIPQPISPYGASKLAGEALCSAYYHSFGLNTISLRFANCYGRYSEHKTSVITKFMDWARQGKPVIIYGDGNQTRDFVHADDICYAIYLSLMALDSGFQTQDSRIFQIGSGVETSIKGLVEMIKETTDLELSITHEPKRRGEIERSYTDITKARTMLGFEPGVKLNDGLHDLWQWYAKEIK